MDLIINQSLRYKMLQNEPIQQNPNKPSLDNGSTNDKYTWKQTLQTLQIIIKIDDDANKKSVRIKIKDDHLFLMCNNTILIDAKWKHHVNSDQSLWMIVRNQQVMMQEVGKYIVLYIDKSKDSCFFWGTPIQGHPQINVKDIIYVPPKPESLQKTEKSTIYKLHDFQCNKKTKITDQSEEQKLQKLKKFMQEHPQMDFSKCKFN